MTNPPLNHASTIQYQPGSEPDSRHYQQIAKAIQFLAADHIQPPSLKETAMHIGLSDSHFQRLFSEWAGVSPKRFQQYLTKTRAKAALQQTRSVLDATLASGISSPGRLHDLMVSCEAMSPGEIKRQAAGVGVRYGLTQCPFGYAFIAWTERGICHFSFVDDDTELSLSRSLMALHTEWPKAHFSQCSKQAMEYVAEIFCHSPALPRPLHILLRGTNFQLKVWEALLKVAPGQLVSYSQLATLAGSPKASRAVGSALARNSLGYLIPCHRVIRESGELGQFRWGTQRKQLMQAWEAARHPSYS